MTHQQTKERLIEEFYAFVKTLPSRVGETPESVLAEFLSHAIDEAAHATENAGELEEQLHLSREPYETHKEAYHEIEGFNACRAKSRRQLDEYFGRNV